MDYIEDDFTDALIDAICGEDLSNNDYREDEQFVQPLNSNGKPLCTIAKTNIIAIKECK